MKHEKDTNNWKKRVKVQKLKAAKNFMYSFFCIAQSSLHDCNMMQLGRCVPHKVSSIILHYRFIV